MLRAMNSGVSGMRNHQVRIDVLGNNIANVNTVGYKSQRVNFQNQFSQTMRGGAAPSGNLGGTNPSQVGLGMTVGSIDLQMSQGALQITGKPTDLAISGEGFFVLNNGIQNVYTRDGQFDFDKQGNLVKTSNGFRVMGWNAQEVNGVPTVVTSRPPEPITVPKSTSIPPKATDVLVFGGNMSSDGKIPGYAVTGNLSSADPVGTTVNGPILEFIGSDGKPSQGQIVYNKTAADTWDVTMQSVFPGTARDGVTPLVDFAPSAPLGTLRFNPTTGAFDATNSTIDNVALTRVPATTASVPLEFKLNPALMTQTASATTSPTGTVAMDINEVAISTKMFDSLGNERSGTMVFTRLSTTEWTARFEHNGGYTEKSPLYLTGKITFDDRGILSSNSIQDLTLNPDLGARSMTMKIDVGQVGQALGFTQFANPDSAVLADQNGYSAGELSGVSLDSSGTVTGTFTNGRTRTLGQVAVANFTNPAGMASAGDNVYVQSNNSGEAQIGIAGVGGRGTLQSGALEGSNVDLAQTFSDLIVAQRGFQSNSRIISTSDEVLQELMSLKR